MKVAFDAEIETWRFAPLVSFACQERRSLLTLVGTPIVRCETREVLFRTTLSDTTVTPQLFVAIVRVILVLQTLVVHVEGEVAPAGLGRATRTNVSRRRATTRNLISRNH